MAELLIRVVDKVNPRSIYKDVGCMKAGSVVCIQPDGWGWSAYEDGGNPAWIVKKWPRIRPDQLSGLLVPEPGDREVQKTLQRRAFVLDLTAVDALRPNPSLTEVLATQRTVKPRSDPNILG